MNHFADKLIARCADVGSHCVVGLDPRLAEMPNFVQSRLAAGHSTELVHQALVEFHELVLDAISGIVPAVKPQAAFFEQYGIAGMLALRETIQMARDRGIFVILDAKRGDIGSTATAYAAAYLGGPQSPHASGDWRADALTVSPYLGRDSLTPFVDACAAMGAGLFVLLRTSNPGSRDLQCLALEQPSRHVYDEVARMIADLGSGNIGDSGYSAVGAVVGATQPEDALKLRAALPRALFLVPGYGSQGGTAADVKVCFNSDGTGALVAATRSLTYSFGPASISPADFVRDVRSRAIEMNAAINHTLKHSHSQR